EIPAAVDALRIAVNAPPNFYAPGVGARIALARVLNGDAQALAALREAHRFLPRPGYRGYGPTAAPAPVLLGYCLAGHRDDAAFLLEEAEHLCSSGDYYIDFLPAQTFAGIAAACAKNWGRSEEHHREAIRRADSQDIPLTQAMTRYWYADML